MARAATDNIWQYISEAQLPLMQVAPCAPTLPDQRHQSHLNTLAVVPGEWRGLISIGSYKDAFAANPKKMEHFIKDYVEEFFPTDSMNVPDRNEATGKCITIPCGRTFNVPPPYLSKPESAVDVGFWVQHFPLQTVARLWHILYPEYHELGFRNLSHGAKDEHDLWQMHVWSRQSIASPHSPAGAQGVVVFTQPPWALSEADLRTFSQAGSINVTDDPDNPLVPDDEDVDMIDTPPERPGSKWPMRSRLWSKIWDNCVVQQSNHFILTTYDFWVFGHFTGQRGVAFVSEPFAYDCKGPTILERIFWWINAAAMGDADKERVIPQVEEPYLGTGDCADDQAFRARVWEQIQLAPRMDPPQSEYDFGDNVSDAGSEAPGLFIDTPCVSAMGSERGSDFGDDEDEDMFDWECATPTTRADIRDEGEVEHWLLDTVSNPPSGSPLNSPQEGRPAPDLSNLPALLWTEEQHQLARLRGLAAPPLRRRPLEEGHHHVFPVRTVEEPMQTLVIPFQDPDRVQVAGGTWMI